ncbi:alpha/beta fold hydrolase [Streptoalloteichus hindustanus]|uniref:CubicO group peptidase, beta-lactamase class C family n=1 Tax=Streptoalloteichus hindustanus TaxID=2017 RepID=A0A1M5NYB5_STRHI|nr:alpha/beta fold hydrolase [Streptoalloteichus hindustanus]SHG94556.1 CubicO group peptidase, beta-lactamase class C family [Streptoalloteichus hindustanus]
MRRTLSVLAVAASAAAVLAAPATAAEAASVKWRDCPFEGPVQCATVPVPTDYRNPNGPKIDIQISRRTSTRPDLRRGTLIMHQGGPGPHLDNAASVDKLLPRSVLDAYDIVSFDQRGFGTSAPVRCGLEPSEQFTFPWPLPGGEPAMRQRAERIAQKCAGQKLMPFMGTANVARDVDRIRAALGERRVSYFGVSYGTYVGVAYDMLFPGRVDRVLLDSNVDPTAAWRGAFRDAMTTGVDVRFNDLAAFLRRDRADLQREFLDLVRKLDQAPLATPSGALTGSHLRITLFSALYRDETFPLVARMMTAARDGDGPAAAEVGNKLGVWYDDDNDASAELGVFCGDVASPRNPELYATEAEADARRYPLTGGAGSAIWPCAFWAHKPIDAPVKANPEGRPNILLVNNLRDPATTHGAATALRRQYGDRARLVSVDHGGHGAYLFGENACAQRIGTDFLVHGVRPPDLTCPDRHAALAGELAHLTGVEGAPGAAAEVRDSTGVARFQSGVADVATGRPMLASDRVRVFSNTKAFVAVVVLQLVAERRVELDAPVERYLPDLIRANGNDGREITVRQLLQHTSGLPDFDSAVFEPGGYSRHRLDHHTPQELVADAVSRPRLSRPGTKFDYSTTNYVVAGMIIEKVTGHRYASEVENRILRPLGMGDTSLPGDEATPRGQHARGYAHLDDEGRISASGRRIDVTMVNPSMVWAGGEAVSTVGDLNTFFAALLGGGLLPPEQLAEMHRTVPADLMPGAEYGLGLIRMPLSCGGEYWTHGGSGLGYQTREGATADGRQVSIVITTSPATRAQSDAMLGAVDTALCAAR